MYGLTLGQMSRLHRSLCASRRCATARLPTISRRCRVRPNHSKNRRIVANNKVAFSPYQSSKSHKNGSIVLLYGPFRRIYGLGRVKLPCPYILRVVQKKGGNIEVLLLWYFDSRGRIYSCYSVLQHNYKAFFKSSKSFFFIICWISFHLTDFGAFWISYL